MSVPDILRPTASLLQALRGVIADHGERPAFDDGQQRLSYAALGRAIDDCAAALGPALAGQRVLLQARHSPQAWAVAFFGCLAAGAVPALADPVWQDDECRTMALRTGCSLRLGDEAWPGAQALDWPLQGARLYRQDLDRVAAPQSPQACAFVRYSSGSTGLPRALAFGDAGALAIARAWRDAAALGPLDRILCYATLNNGLAFNTSLLPGLLSGACLRLEARFLTAGAVLAAARQFRPTVFVAFPLVYEFLARRPAAALREALADCRLRLSSAAALGASTRALWRDTHGMPIGNYYGVAELGPVSFNDGSDADGMGQPLPGVDLALPAADAPLDQRACLTTPWMALGCIGEADGGGLQAGRPYAVSDRIERDPAGRVRLLGRHDDVINLHGKKVALGGLRDSLQQALGGQVFAVVPVHRDSGSYLALHLESAPGAPPPDVQQVRQTCARVLPAHALPRHIHVHARLPRSSAGKLLVAQLQSLEAA